MTESSVVGKVVLMIKAQIERENMQAKHCLLWWNSCAVDCDRKNAWASFARIKSFGHGLNGSATFLGRKWDFSTTQVKIMKPFVEKLVDSLNSCERT